MRTVRDSIVEALREAGDFVSGQQLGVRFGISRAAIWKHMDALKRDGYLIESSHARGYKLVDGFDRLEASFASTAPVATKWLGRPAIFKDVTDSTNSDALELGRGDAPHGTIVCAEEQRAGRGRMGRTWESARGLNLYLSMLLRPAVAPARAPQLSLVAGVAVAETLSALGVEARIKWPNDIVAGKRKLCGILTEVAAEGGRVSHVVVGVGVNLNSLASDFPPALRARATSVRMVTGRTVDRGSFLRSLLLSFEGAYTRYLDGGFAAVAPAWRRRSYLQGRPVEVEGVGSTVSGRCLGVDDDGALLVDTGGGVPVRVMAGDVTLRDAY